MEETASGNNCYADVLHQVPRELQVVQPGDAADVGHDVIGAARDGAAQADLLQAVEQGVPAMLIGRSEIPVVLGRQAESGCARFLQRGGCAHRQKVVDLPDPRGERGGGDRIAHAPTCHAIGLAQAVDRDGSIAHPVQGCHGAVAEPVIEYVLVDLVGYGDHVPPMAELRDTLAVPPSRIPCPWDCWGC